MSKIWKNDHTKAERLAKMLAGRTIKTLMQRFWEKVDKRGPDDCWNWTGSCTKRGYGQLFTEKNANGHPAADLAHRVAYRLHYGPIPADRPYIDHMCRNKICVNAAHLRAVTVRQSALENCNSPIAANATKTHCSKCRNPLSGPNLAVVIPGKKKNRYGNWKPGKPQRQCLTCYPHLWKWAVVPRSRPPRGYTAGEKKRREVLAVGIAPRTDVR